MDRLQNRIYVARYTAASPFLRYVLTLFQATPTDNGGRLSGVHGPTRGQTYRMYLFRKLHGFFQGQERDVVVLERLTDEY